MKNKPCPSSPEAIQDESYWDTSRQKRSQHWAIYPFVLNRTSHWSPGWNGCGMKGLKGTQVIFPPTSLSISLLLSSHPLASSFKQLLEKTEKGSDCCFFLHLTFRAIQKASPQDKKKKCPNTMGKREKRHRRTTSSVTQYFSSIKQDAFLASRPEGSWQ